MKKLLLPLSILPLLTGCNSSDDISMVSLGIDDAYRVERMRKLPLSSALTGERYSWKLDGHEVSTDRSYIFLGAEPGVYTMSFDIIDPANPFHHDFTVTVMEEDVAYSPYISEVVEYRPAPASSSTRCPNGSRATRRPICCASVRKASPARTT